MAGTVVDSLLWWSHIAPDREAIVFEDDRVTYAELNSWADAVAADLRGKGVSPGDRIGIVGKNSPAWCAAALGALKIGAIAAPFAHRLVPAEFAALVQDCAPTVVYADEELAPRLEAVLAQGYRFDLRLLEHAVAPLRAGGAEPAPLRDPDLSEPAMIVFTSGTTGRSKGVVFDHANLTAVTHEWSLIESVRPAEFRPLVALPLWTCAGMVWGIARTIVHGGTMFLLARLDAEPALRTIIEHRVTTVNGPPILFERIAGARGFADADLSHITTAHVGGAPVPVTLLRAWERQGVCLRQIYGQTEIGGTATANPPESAASNPEKCGRGGIFTRIRVIGPDGTDRAPGEPGEIVLRGPGMTRGYWRNDAATRSTIVDGWIRTGDLGVLDAAGSLTFVDRMKDMIISGGLNISPAEIERTILAIPGVEEVAVIGVEDPKFGETPAAVVHPRGALTAGEVVAHCNEHLADYKVPRYVVLLDEPLPRMSSGKIAKRELRTQYSDIAQRYEKVR
ncbi:AMP-binding protein [Nocardia sp. NPDC052254]|uniref:class I adenylate-forming enzyme family protein n=1 Tax=Nocardia sp. NPDC052254 TaxID=3155681 RepID=UPI003425F13B